MSATTAVDPPTKRSAPAAAARRSPSRVVIEGVTPRVDGGRFPIKRVEGELVRVEATIFADGHDALRALVKHRPLGEDRWRESAMRPEGNDRWSGSFAVGEIGRWEYTIEAWIDRFASWQDEVRKKNAAGQDVASELLEGAALIREAAARSEDEQADWLSIRADLVGGASEQAARVAAGLEAALKLRMDAAPDRSLSDEYGPALELIVDPVRARFGSWYECFPRSCAPEPGRHGTLRDLEARLPSIADMGFDVLYLPPIHPIGRSFRKGPNNTLTPGPDDPGSPWAIGAAEGGHTSILPELGTLGDFDALVESARSLGLQVALDIAFQCAPDHPWVKEHPEWFRHRPDGSIKYAENPPKKYQDIYPLEFEGPDWQGLWNALLDVFRFWVGHGVTIFRVDNPHTKPFRFWEWCIGKLKAEHPEVILLSEAFTRPALMKRLAKGGFTQSYTYFTWRNDKDGLVEYLQELAHGESRDYMRPNLFANTPDILHEYLQTGGRAAFQIRAVLASMLGATYGVYGPPFEQCVGTPVREGSEEYLDSEKYQVRHWDLEAPGNLSGLLRRLNQIRREHPALQANDRLWFHQVDNGELVAFSKSTPDLSDIVTVVVNVSPFHAQGGWLHLPLDAFGMGWHDSYEVEDLLDGSRYAWHGSSNFVALDPYSRPAHVFALHRG